MALPSVQRVFLESVASTDPEGRFIEVNGIQTYYKKAIPQSHGQLLQNQQSIPNEPNKPVILLLHHFLGNLYTWRHHMQPLADNTGCHVIAYDRPTFGFTERPTKWEEGRNPYTQEASVEFAVQLVANLGYENRKIALVGVSGGGSIICGIAVKYPDLVHSLCLLAPSIRHEDQGPPPIGRHILGSAPGRLFLKIALYQYLPITLFYHNTNSIPDWETVICSHIKMEVFDEIASSCPNVKMEFKVINECGHLPQDEKPQEVLNSVINFLLSLQI
ncbi:alpha/beta hydrolase [Rhizophagus clarus]|uniref:Alpha/beta hydrolase n=1 Tax=Rhizophagus clarus TaxID=94130 RepID=A0A8H3R3B4_9GLOM|nr:alpha/beta hydrolase [Rhizophagus clarus]